MSQSFRGDKQRREQLPPGIPGRSSTHLQTAQLAPAPAPIPAPGWTGPAALPWLRSSRQHSAATRKDQPGWDSSSEPQHPPGAARRRSRAEPPARPAADSGRRVVAEDAARRARRARAWLGSSRRCRLFPRSGRALASWRSKGGIPNPRSRGTGARHACLPPRLGASRNPPRTAPAPAAFPEPRPGAAPANPIFF